MWNCLNKKNCIVYVYLDFPNDFPNESLITLKTPLAVILRLKMRRVRTK